MVRTAGGDDTDKPLYVVCREKNVIRLYNKRCSDRVVGRSEDGEVKSYAILVPFDRPTEKLTVINRLGRTEEEEVFICSKMHELNAQFGCAQVTSVWFGTSLVWVDYSPVELAIDATTEKFENITADVDAVLAKFISVFGPSLTEEWQKQEASVVEDVSEESDEEVYDNRDEWFLRLLTSVCLDFSEPSLIKTVVIFHKDSANTLDIPSSMVIESSNDECQWALDDVKEDMEASGVTFTLKEIRT